MWAQKPWKIETQRPTGVLSVTISFPAGLCLCWNTSLGPRRIPTPFQDATSAKQNLENIYVLINVLLDQTCSVSSRPVHKGRAPSRPSHPSRVTLWPQPIGYFLFVSSLLSLSYKCFLPFVPFWRSLKGDHPLHEVLNKVYLYHLSCLSVQFSSVAQACLTLCNPMNCSMPGLPVHHQLPEFTQTHVHRVNDVIQPSHPLSSPSPPAPNSSQHQGLFRQVSSSHEVAKVLEFQLQHQSFQWTPRTDLL